MIPPELGPGQPRDYLRALQQLLAQAPLSDRAAREACVSLQRVLDASGPVDWDAKTTVLYELLGEIERASELSAEPTGERS